MGYPGGIKVTLSVGEKKVQDECSVKGSWPGAGGGACAGGCSRGWWRVASGASVVQARRVSVSRTLPHDSRPLAVMD